MKRCKLICLSLSFLIAGIVSLPATYVQGQGTDGADTQYITDDAVLAVVAFPRRVFLSDRGEMLPREIVTAAGMQEFGVDPLLIDRVTLFAPPPVGEPRFGMALHFIESPNLKDWKLPDTTNETVNGKTVRKMDFGGPTFMEAEGNVVLVGDSATMAAMVEGNRGDSPLRKLVSESNDISDVNLFVAMEPVRELVKQGMAFVEIPEPFADVQRLPDLIESVSVHGDIDLMLKLKMHVAASDEADAKELDSILSDLMVTGRGMMVAAIEEEMGNSEDPVEIASMQYVQRISEKVAGMLKPEVNGNRLTISMDDEIATTGVLVGLLLPAVQAAREAARRTQSVNNLKQLALAMHIYHDVHGKFPPPAILSEDGEPLLSWRVAILPYIEQEELYDQFHLDEPWNSEHNRTLIEQMPPVLTNPNLIQNGKTNYLIPRGENTLFASDEGVRLRDILDGTSNTLMILEVDADRVVTWTKPEDLDVDLDFPMDGLGSLRPGGFSAALCDGSVQFFSTFVEEEVLKALFTPKGGEVVDAFR